MVAIFVLDRLMSDVFHCFLCLLGPYIVIAVAMAARTYHVVEANKVLEGEGGGKAGFEGEVLLGNDLEELQGVLGFLLFDLEEGLSCRETILSVCVDVNRVIMGSKRSQRWDVNLGTRYLSGAAEDPALHPAAGQSGCLLPS